MPSSEKGLLVTPRQKHKLPALGASSLGAAEFSPLPARSLPARLVRSGQNL